MMIPKRKIFLITIAAALLARVVYFSFFRETLFQFYHLVPGLDMQTLLRFSEWGEGGSGFDPFLTPHRVLIYAVWKVNGMVHAPWVVIFIQTLLGIGGAVALADVALSLSGRRRTALAAGVFYGIYLPFMLYEFSLLQETFAINLTLLAIWSSLRAVKRRFAPAWAAVSGILWALALMGRPTALFAGIAVWAAVIIYGIKRKFQKNVFKSLTIFLLLLGGAGIFNTMWGWRTGPFYNVIPYTLEYNASRSESGADAPAPAGRSLVKSGWNAVKRTPRLLSLKEVPENLNLEFLRHKIPALRIFPGPEILLSCTVFFGMMMIFSGKFRRKEFLVFSVILLLALPLCAREAIGRYRLMLCPWFILVSCFGFREFVKFAPLQRAIYGIFSIAMVAGTALFASHPGGLRSSDFHAWALAAEAHYGSGERSTLKAYYEFFEAGRFSNALAFQTFCRQAFLCNDSGSVKKAIILAERNGVEKSLVSYFKALIYVGENDPQAVAAELEKVDRGKLPEELRKNFLRIKADTQRIIEHSKR